MRALLQRQSAAAGSAWLLRSGTSRTLAAARSFVASAAFVATLIGAASLDDRARFLLPLLGAYAALALTDLIVGCRRRRLRGLSPIVMHLIDLSVAAAATLLTNGVNGPFFFLLLFPVLAAAYRW